MAEEEFKAMGITAAWEKYKDVLTWGKGQTLAVLDDGCDLEIPEWKVVMPWGPKVVDAWDAVENEADPTPAPNQKHGTFMGFPSSLNYEGKGGVAFNNQVAQVRAVVNVHIKEQNLEAETQSMKRALQWVMENRERLNITSVNLSPLDDKEHPGPVTSELDPVLTELRNAGVWVSAPCGNNGFTRGFSWPAISPFCFAIGASGHTGGGPSKDKSRSIHTDLFAPAKATSSSNALMAGSAMVLREAIEKFNFDWKSKGANLPEAMLAIFKETGAKGHDQVTRHPFHSANLLNALDMVTRGKTSP